MEEKQIESNLKEFQDNDEDSDSMNVLNEEEMLESTNQAKLIKDIEMKLLNKEIKVIIEDRISKSPKYSPDASPKNKKVDSSQTS